MKLKELFADPSRWTQGADAKTAEGCPTIFEDETAVCYCLEGALQKLYPETHEKLFEVIREELGVVCLFVWNDAPERTIEDIQAICNKLDI